MTLAPADVRGFNYSGSWGSSGLDVWLHHDRARMESEIANAATLFPGWNLARWWLSFEAYQRRPEKFLADFEAGLRTFDRHGIVVIPVLFNRWRDTHNDFGGIWIDHFVQEGAYADVDEDGPGSSVYQPEFRRYLDAVVGTHRDDPRIWAWDLCNEPQVFTHLDTDHPLIAAELRWLGWVAGVTRKTGATQQITIGSVGLPLDEPIDVQLVEPLVDLLSFHPYWVPDIDPDGARFRGLITATVAFAASVGKDLLITECCWGANSDDERVRRIRGNLDGIRERGLGFVVHALQHSRIADLHRPEYGPVGVAGVMHFVEEDGSLRPGHEVFNEYT
jgi:hypothetical protein